MENQPHDIDYEFTSDAFSVRFSFSLKALKAGQVALLVDEPTDPNPPQKSGVGDDNLEGNATKSGASLRAFNVVPVKAGQLVFLVDEPTDPNPGSKSGMGDDDLEGGSSEGGSDGSEQQDRGEEDRPKLGGDI